MFRTVPFQDRMEARHTDFNNFQSAARESVDRLTADAVTAGTAGYAGFLVTQSSATELKVAPGRLYRGDGSAFIMTAEVTRSVVSILPTATQRLVALIAYGQEEDSQTDVRDFWVDLEADTTEPRTVPVERRRSAIVDLVPGQESGTLPRPAIDQALTVIAWVTLGPVGILSISMEPASQLPSVRDNRNRLNVLEDWRSRTDPRVNTIDSSIAALKASVAGLASQGELLSLMRDVARVKEILEIPDDASDWAADRYLTTDETDVDNVDLNVLVEEGLRFRHDGRNETQLALYNPLDVNAYQAGNGLLLPAISGKSVRLASSSGASVAAVSIAQYGFQTHEMVQRSVSRQRIRYGTTYEVCTNAQWWRDGAYDSATNTFSRAGETFLVTSGDPARNHQMVRVTQFFVDTWEEPYWDYVTTDRTISGAQVAQSFLNPQDGWLAELRIRVTEKGADGDLAVSLCELTPAGTPDPTKLIAHVVVPHASIKVSPTATVIDVPPTFVSGGKRYAWLLTTLGSHKIQLVDGSRFSQGTFFYTTDGLYYAGDLTRDIWFEMGFLDFSATRREIELGALTLSGGIAAIDILAGAIVPKSCSLQHQVLVNGVWRSIDNSDPTIFAGLPPLLRHRVVMQGTPSVMPAIVIPESRVVVWRPRTTMKHISTTRTLATEAGTIRVDLQVCNFDPGRHTLTVKLRKEDGSLVSATGYTDRTVDAKRRVRSFSFTLDPAIDTYKIAIEGTTNNALAPFLIEERVDIAL